MVSFLTGLACFIALLGISSCAYETIFKDIYTGTKSEKELRHHLFQNYDKLVRPVKDARQKISVGISITPVYIRELDEKNQVLILESWIAMKWTDDFIRWDPSRFGNITTLRVPSTEIWRPDFAVYTSPDPATMFPIPNTNALLYNNGMVLWVPLFTIHSRCPILKASKKLLTCNIKIGSWTFSEPLLDIQLTSKKVDLTNFSDSNLEWKLMDVSVEREEKFYPCCTEAYVSMNFNMTLKKRPEYSSSHDNMKHDKESGNNEQLETTFSDIVLGM